MSRLRQRGHVRISFFSFQDIITSVTGILILVTLMLSFSLRFDEAPMSLESKIENQRQRLAQIEKENAALQQRRIEATALPDPTQAQILLESLRREEAQARAERETSERTLKALANSAERERLQVEVATLNQRVEQLREQLAKERANTNVLQIIPDAETRRSQKTPALFVVSGERLSAQRLNGAIEQDIAIAGADSLLALLRRFNPARDFIVFYFRPSGAKWFDAFRDVARTAGFEVGYDAVEENKQIVFNSP